MNRNRLLVAGLVAVVLGLLAGNFVYRRLSRTEVARPVRMEQMVVAGLALPLGTKLEPQHLRTIPWPSGDPVPGMFKQVEEAVGRALITPLVENEPILETKLAPKEAGSGLPAAIPEGMRAVSVPVNDVVAVAGFVMPGTMVDVLVTGSVEGRGGNNSITRIILENVRVLAAGQKVEQDKEGKPQTVPVITLLVTPEDATKLTMASMEGRIQLALRNTIDSKKVSPAPVQRASLFGGAPKPVTRKAGPQPKPDPTFVVEVIRGDKRETKSFQP